MSDLQVIWSIAGHITPLIEKLHMDYPNEDPTIRVHLGQDNYNRSMRKGDDMKPLLAPDEVPNPVVALATVDAFGHANVYPTLASNCLLVDGAFLSLVEDDVLESCMVYDALGVMANKSGVISMTREELLREPVRARLFLINPTYIIPVDEPIDRDQLLFVPGNVQLPPFFRVPWWRSGVYIRDDIRQRLDRAGMVGQVYNFLPYALQQS